MELYLAPINCNQVSPSSGQLTELFLLQSNESTCLEFLGEMVGDESGETGEERCQEHAYIPHIHGDVQEVQEVVQDGRR